MPTPGATPTPGAAPNPGAGPRGGDATLAVRLAGVDKTFTVRGGGRTKAYIAGALYAGTAICLAIGMYAAYLPQHRL